MNYLKNKTKIVLLLFAISFSTVNAQEIVSKITYKKKSNIIIDTIKQKATAGIFIKKMSNKMNNLEYTLKFNSFSSVFKETSRMTLDKDKNSLAVKLSKLLGGGSGIFYTNRKTNKIYHEKELEAEVFLIEQNINNDWNVTQEKKNLGKYICYKAIKNDTYVGSSGNLINRKIIAWYTPQIPFSYGPLNYSGLPGLILEIQNDKVIFYATKIELYKKENLENIPKPKKGIKITQRKYDSIVIGLAKGLRKRIRN